MDNYQLHLIHNIRILSHNGNLMRNKEMIHLFQDGFLRQKHLQSLLLMDYDDWVIPNLH